MSKINMQSWKEQLLSSSQCMAMPLMTHPGIELIGKTVKDACFHGHIQFEAIRALVGRYPTAAYTAIMDLTVEAEAFGAEISATDDAVPAVVGHLLQGEGDIEKLAVPSLDSARVPEYLKANCLAAQFVTDKPFFGGCIGPYSLAGRLYDMTEIMMLIYINPEAADMLLEKCTAFITDYCLAMREAGSDGVIMAEPAAGLLSNEDCSRFSSRFIKKIVDRVQDDHFMVVLHNCGNTGHCTQAMVETGAMGYHFGNKADMAEVILDVPSSALAMGNIDPVSVFKMGTPEGMKQHVTKLLEQMEGHHNFVLSSGCDTPPHTPLANIDAFFEALENYYAE